LIGSSALALGVEIFDTRISNSEMGYHKSVYVVPDYNYPLGQVTSFRFLARLVSLRMGGHHELGVRQLDSAVKNVTMELPARWSPDFENRVYFGNSLRPGPTSGINSFVAYSRTKEMKVTFRLVLVDEKKNRVPFSKLSFANKEEWFGSVSQYVRYYTKTAQLSGAEEVALAPEIVNSFCQEPSEFLALTSMMRQFYGGRIRLDFDSLDSKAQNASCLSTLGSNYDAIAIEPSVNPSVAEISKIIKSGLPIAKLSFDGPANEQLAKAQNISSISGFKSAAVTWGTYYIDPHIGGEQNSGDTFVDKPLGKFLDQWFLD
jgi:hypothetical protein